MKYKITMTFKDGSWYVNTFDFPSMEDLFRQALVSDEIKSGTVRKIEIEEKE